MRLRLMGDLAECFSLTQGALLLKSGPTGGTYA